jgi:predicted nucleotidyltransferase
LETNVHITGHTPPDNVIYPNGTQVVTNCVVGSLEPKPAGSVAVILEYHPRIPAYTAQWVSDGKQITLLPWEISIRKHGGASRLEEALGFDYTATPEFVEGNVLYSCVVGSTAFGMSTPESDSDVRGVFQLPADSYRSLVDPPKLVRRERNGGDEEYWELRHFLDMALKANPNIIETLYTPIFVCHNDIGRELLRNRSRLLSRRAYETYNGYVASQYRKIEQDLRTKGEVKRKHAMHLIRLLLSGIHLMRHGIPLIDVGPYRDSLFAIKSGEMPWSQVLSWRSLLSVEFEAEYAETTLPLDPDFTWANDFLIRARKSLDE